MTDEEARAIALPAAVRYAVDRWVPAEGQEPHSLQQHVLDLADYYAHYIRTGCKPKRPWKDAETELEAGS